MDIYEKDSDHFSQEYLGYLGTLTSEVVSLGDSRLRVTRNPDGVVVRYEVWDYNRYYDFPTERWMKEEK